MFLWINRQSLRIGRQTGDFVVTLAKLEQALLNPATDPLMDVVMSRLLLTRAQAAELPPERGMGYEWWEPALRRRVQAWFERRDKLLDEIQRRQELAEVSSGEDDEEEQEEDEEEEEEEQEEEGDGDDGDGGDEAGIDPNGVVADGSDALALLPGDRLVDLAAPEEAWRAEIRKGAKAYGQDSVGDWWKVNIVDERYAGNGAQTADALEVQLHYHGWKSTYDEWVSVRSMRLSSPMAPRPRNAADPPLNPVDDRNWQVGQQVLLAYEDEPDPDASPGAPRSKRNWPAEVIAVHHVVKAGFKELSTIDIAFTGVGEKRTGETECGIEAKDPDLRMRAASIAGGRNWKAGTKVMMGFINTDNSYAEWQGEVVEVIEPDEEDEDSDGAAAEPEEEQQENHTQQHDGHGNGARAGGQNGSSLSSASAAQRVTTSISSALGAGFAAMMAVASPQKGSPAAAPAAAPHTASTAAAKTAAAKPKAKPQAKLTIEFADGQYEEDVDADDIDLRWIADPAGDTENDDESNDEDDAVVSAADPAALQKLLSRKGGDESPAASPVEEPPAQEEDLSALSEVQLDKALRDMSALIKPSTGGYYDSQMAHLSLGEECPLREDRRGRSYAELPPRVRALILQRLCEANLEARPEIKTQMTENEMEVDDLRLDPLGVDNELKRYFYFPMFYRDCR